MIDFNKLPNQWNASEHTLPEYINKQINSFADPCFTAAKKLHKTIISGHSIATVSYQKYESRVGILYYLP